MKRFLPVALVLGLMAMLHPAGSSSAEVVDLSDAPAYPEITVTTESVTGSRDIVLLGADLVEIAVALGASDRVLARPLAPGLTGVDDIPHVFRERPGIEGIAAMRPGTVIASNIRFDSLRNGLEQIGIQTALIDRTLPATQKVRRLAAHLGAEDRGEALVDAIEQEYANAPTVTAPDGEKLRIMHASKAGAGGNFSVGGSGTAVHNLIQRVGGINPAAEIGKDRYRGVTPEGILLMKPDVVLISAEEMDVFGNLDRFWTEYPGIALTPAGRNKRIIIMRDMHVRADAASSGIATRALSEGLARMFEEP